MLQVTSEINRLKKVLLHRPGFEVENLTPDTMERLLFDDIPDLEVAQQEHDAFAQVLRDNGVEVVYLDELMTETLDGNKELKEQFIRQYIEEAGIKREDRKQIVYDFLNNIEDTNALVRKTMAGIYKKELPVSNEDTLAERMVGDYPFEADPMPNLYFTRDPFATIGNGISMNRMYSVTRNRETIYADYIFNYHKDYAGTVERFYNRDFDFHIEGGDILNLTEKVLAIGVSQRTQAEAIDKIANEIFYNSSNDKLETILVFDIPNNRAMMHLDTVFTQIDYDKFTIHPGIEGTLTVFEVNKGENGIEIVEVHDSLENILAKHLGVEKVTLIRCGGGDKVAGDREQWNDGSNTLCIRPGHVVVYSRNKITNRILQENGITLHVIPSAELSRGRGGPRCMSMPLIREV